MSTHPILIRNHLQAGDGPREVLLVHQGRVMPVSPALLSAGPFCGAGYIDAHGRWLVAPDLEKTHPFHDGLSGFRKDGLVGYMNLDGGMAIATRWTGGQHFSDGLAAVPGSGAASEPFVARTALERRHWRRRRPLWLRTPALEAIAQG
ncbi:WG repeat-containing protein [Massilia violaceinigra]|uniref:WG repeat-containing protein n=1 Tax=Massilia violaceinigra TaxID=2045208 RepID=A0ABY4A5M2_9BURK|nr:WG repeat-containing protein [Massilia violaceinigra]UOD30096.1 WG repeat-containing protein [Massilia violaceinigra]